MHEQDKSEPSLMLFPDQECDASNSLEQLRQDMKWASPHGNHLRQPAWLKD